MRKLGCSLYSAMYLYLRMNNRPPADWLYTDFLGKLTTRETQIFKQLILGRKTREIAAEFHISVKTVETHRQHILAKGNKTKQLRKWDGFVAEYLAMLTNTPS